MYVSKLEIILLQKKLSKNYKVFYNQSGERLIGDAAKNQLTGNPLNTVFDAKRMIGRKWGDTQIKEDMKYFPFKVREHRGKPHIQVKVKGNDKVRILNFEIMNVN